MRLKRVVNDARGARETTSPRAYAHAFAWKSRSNRGPWRMGVMRRNIRRRPQNSRGGHELQPAALLDDRKPNHPPGRRGDVRRLVLCNARASRALSRETHQEQTLSHSPQGRRHGVGPGEVRSQGSSRASALLASAQRVTAFDT